MAHFTKRSSFPKAAAGATLAGMGDVTSILERLEHKDAKAADELYSCVYEELRTLAAAKMARERPGLTLQPTALVHEAWLRLGGDAQPGMTCN